MKTQISTLLLATAFLVGMSSCSNNPTKNETQLSDSTAVAVQEKPNSLTLEANDAMQFSKTELRATAGQEISLTLKNSGKMEKSVMGHDFVLLKPGVDIPAFGHEAMSAVTTDYIPESQRKSIIAYTKLLGPGESDTIQFTITEKGTYDYICSFPGHYMIMKGKLIIE